MVWYQRGNSTVEAMSHTINRMDMDGMVVAW